MFLLRKINNTVGGIYARHRITLYNFLWRAIQILGKQGVTFVIFVLCAKYLSPYEFGIYNFVFSLIFMFAIFSDFGVSVTASRYTAQYQISDIKKLHVLPFNSTLIVVVLSTIVCLLVFFARDKIKYYEYLIYCFPLLFAIPMTSLYDGIYRGLKKFKELSLINFIFGLLFIPLIYFSINKWGIKGAILAHNAYYILLFIVVYCYSFTWKMKTKAKLDKELIVKILKYSVLVGLSDVGLFLYTRVDVLILGHFNLVEEIGYYEIANRMYLILILPAQLLATVVAPKIAQIFLLKKNDLIKSNYKRDVLLLFGIGLVLAGVSYFSIGYIFALLFDNYKSDILLKLMTILLILVPFRYFSTYISIGYITPSGNVKISTLAIMFFGIVNVLLDFLLIKEFGLFGVVYATIISQILFMLVKDLFFYYSVIRKL